MSNWLFPLPLQKLGTTSDSMSFLNIDITKQCEIPVISDDFDESGRQHHFGAFGVKRKFHYHKGTDLYCPEGTCVYAVEPGIVVQIRPFTGERAGCHWWNDTEAVSVVGKTGLVVYGEIVPDYHLKIGDVVERGQLIGWVKRVLREDKGRPTSMLHLELHEHHMLHTEDKWQWGKVPKGLLDPTSYLAAADQNPKANEGLY